MGSKVREDSGIAKEPKMPLETTLVSIAATVAFGGYALLLGWGLWFTRKA